MNNRLSIVILLLPLLAQARCPNDPNCMSCDKNSCIKCYQSYMNIDGQCITPSAVIPNCKFYSSNKRCLECQYGYYLEKNICVKIGIKNCAVSDARDDSICVGCFDSKQVVDNSCTHNQECPDKNCEICISTFNHKCLQCHEGFSLFEGFCLEEETSNCLVSSDQRMGECKICRPGYYDNGEGCVAFSSIYKLTLTLLLAFLL